VNVAREPERVERNREHGEQRKGRERSPEPEKREQHKHRECSPNTTQITSL